MIKISNVKIGGLDPYPVHKGLPKPDIMSKNELSYSSVMTACFNNSAAVVRLATDFTPFAIPSKIAVIVSLFGFSFVNSLATISVDSMTSSGFSKTFK